MRRARAIPVALLLSALGILPGPRPGGAQEPPPARADTVVAAVLANWPPYYGLTPADEPTGFAVEVFEAVARRAGFVPAYRVYETFPQVMDAVLAGEADVVPNMGMLQGRPFLFTATTDAFRVAFFVRASTPGSPAPDEVDGVVAIVESNVGVELADAWDPAPTTRTYANVREALFRLLAGEVDGLIYPAPVIRALARQARVDDRLREVELDLQEVKRAMAVAPGRTALLDRLDAGLADLLGSREYEALYERWLAPPEPFWTVPRAAGAGLGAAFLLSLGFLVLRRRDRERSSRTLRRSEHRYEALFESIRDAIVVTDTDRRIVALNGAARELFECDAEELLGRHTLVLYENEQDYEEFGERLRDGGSEPGFVVTIRYRTLRGRTFPGETTAFFLRTREGGAPAGFIGIIRDVTERLEAEERTRELQGQLAQAQKMESVGRLAGGVAHDFNNMLTVIQGQTELLLEEEDAPPRLRAPLREIQEAADRSARLTRQLLAFARRQHIDPEPLDPNGAVAGTLTMLERLIGKHVRLAWRPSPEAWLVYVDPVQVDQILTNLVVNARDAMAGSGGSIRIETENVVLADTSDPEGQAGEFVRLSVHDDGAGMSEDVLAHVFDPFYTTKPTGEGTGLGMATVYGIARQNGGFVTIESEPDAGTSVHVHLPRYQGAPPSSDPASEPRGAHGRGESVLLVEDDESVLGITARLLERMGYRVHGVAEPAAALELDPRRFDLLITDLSMPGMNGRELARRIRERAPDLPVLYVSGYSADILREEAEGHPGTHVLPKPFTLADLADKIGEVLRGREPDPGG